jgi:protein phosphatase
VDLSHQALRQDDVLVMCSDGLSGLVKRDEIGELAGRIPVLPELCSALIDLANERGGPDNITVVAARFGGAGLALPGEADDVGYHGLAVEELPTTELPVAAPLMAPEARSGSPRALLIGALIVALLVALALIELF